MILQQEYAKDTQERVDMLLEKKQYNWFSAQIIVGLYNEKIVT